MHSPLPNDDRTLPTYENWTLPTLPTNSVDLDAYIEAYLGPVRLPLTWLLPLTSVYGFIFLTGVIGNACTCLVIAKNQYMQTATNCYLCNLAVADILTLICAMPLELYTLWHQYPWQLGLVVCELRAIIPEATAYASILTIVTFSIERYLAICHPIRPQGSSKLTRASRNITIIWVLSLIGATPYGIFSKVNYLTAADGDIIFKSAWCGFPFNDPDRSWETLMLCSTFMFFVVPMTLIVVLYARIALTLRETGLNLHERDPGLSSENGTNYRSNSDRLKSQSRRIVIRMLAAVVLAFFVCWAPFHTQRLLFLYVSLYGEWTDNLKNINQDLYSLAGCFYYFNATINPILYSVMSNRFRVAFREKLCSGTNCISTTWRFICCSGEPPRITTHKPDSKEHRYVTSKSAHSSVTMKRQFSHPSGLQNHSNNYRSVSKEMSQQKSSGSHSSYQNSVRSCSALKSPSTSSGNDKAHRTVLEHSCSYSWKKGAPWTRNPIYDSVSLGAEVLVDRKHGTGSKFKRSHPTLTNLNNAKYSIDWSCYPSPGPGSDHETILTEIRRADDILKETEEMDLTEELNIILAPELAKLQHKLEGNTMGSCLNCARCASAASSVCSSRGNSQRGHCVPYLNSAENTDISQLESDETCNVSSNTNESYV